MEFQAYDVAIIPIIIAVVQLVAKSGVPNRFLPLVSLALGLVSGFIYIAPDDPKKAVLVGLVMGLSAVGAYSGVKNTMQKK